MFKNGLILLSDKKHLALIAFFIVITLSIFVDSIIVFLPFPILGFLVLRYQLNFVLFAIVVSFFTITNTIDPNLRLVVQIVNYTIVAFLFLYQYGLDFKRYPKIPLSVCLFILSLLLLMFISSMASNYVVIGLAQFMRQIIFLGLVYGLFSFIKSTKEVKLYIYSILMSSFIFFIVLQHQLLQNNFDLTIFFGYQIVEMGNKYLGKNYLGTFFSIIILILLSISFSKQYRSKRFLIYIILFILFLSLVITNSRASILCLSFGVLFIFFRQNRSLFWGSILTFALLSYFLFISPFSEVIEDYSRLDNIGTGREYLIQATLEVIKNNFVLGAGPGGTKYEMYVNLPFLLGSIKELTILRNFNAGDIGQAHNFYLFYFGDLGIGGLVLALTLPVVFFRLCYFLLNRLNNSGDEEYYIVLGITSVGIFMFIRGLFEPQNILTYGGISSDLPFWLLISIISFYYMKYKNA